MSYTYITVTTEIGSETVTVVHTAKDEIWEIDYIREQILDDMRLRLAKEVVKRLTIRTIEENAQERHDRLYKAA